MDQPARAPSTSGSTTSRPAPGQGYPRQWADQARWNGGWELDRKGRLRLKAGGRVKKLLTIFSNPDLPAIDDYYEPFTYDYETLVDAPLGDLDPVARPHSQLTGKPMDVDVGPELGRGPRRRPGVGARRTRTCRASRSRCG